MKMLGVSEDEDIEDVTASKPILLLKLQQRLTYLFSSVGSLVTGLNVSNRSPHGLLEEKCK